MSCSNPNRMFRIGVKDNGKNDLLFAKRHCDHLEFFNNSWHRCFNSFTSPRAERISRDFVDVPCGRCLGCRLDHSREWANRCLMEMLYHEHNLFITLTYDNQHLPYFYSLDDVKGGYSKFNSNEYGVCCEEKLLSINTLRKKDLQDFIKRLRKYYESQEPKQKIRYFACGEYGDKTYRPHYHLIVFGAWLNDLVLYSSNSTGNTYTSDTLTKIWSKGNVLVCDANYNTAAYTARYVVKKAGNETSTYISKYGIEPEFFTMSRRPGIGAWFYDNHDVFTHDSIVIGTDTGNKKFKPPRYFEKLLEREDPEKFKEYKERNNLFAKLTEKNWTRQTDMDPDTYYASRDVNLKKKTKGLERRKV